MSSKGNKEFVYEGFTLPRLKVKEILASNAREDIELKNLHKQLDKEKDELETDFSKTRSQLLSRAFDHHMTLEGQPSEFENSADSWETTSFSTLNDFSSSQDQDVSEINLYSHPSNYHPKPKQTWAEKVTQFEPSLAARNELSASRSHPRRKISLGGRANPHVENWDTARNERLEQSLVVSNQVDALETQTKRKTSWAGRSKANSENWDAGNSHFEQCVARKTHQPDEGKLKHNRKISWGERAHVYMNNWDSGSKLRKSISEESVFSEPRATHSREQNHTVAGGSKSFSNKSSVLTKKTLQKQRLPTSTTSKHVVSRRHTVCCRPNKYDLSSPVKEHSSQQKPLADLLPPIKLPPVYLQENKDKNQEGRKRDNNVVNTGEKYGSKSHDDTIRDLKYCRYLRIKTKDGEEYASW